MNWILFETFSNIPVYESEPNLLPSFCSNKDIGL